MRQVCNRLSQFAGRNRVSINSLLHWESGSPTRSLYLSLMSTLWASSCCQSDIVALRLPRRVSKTFPHLADTERGSIKNPESNTCEKFMVTLINIMLIFRSRRCLSITIADLLTSGKCCIMTWQAHLNFESVWRQCVLFLSKHCQNSPLHNMLWNLISSSAYVMICQNVLVQGYISEGWGLCVINLLRSWMQISRYNPIS